MNISDITFLCERLRDHANLHEEMRQFDDEQRNWAADLRTASELIERCSDWLAGDCSCPCCEGVEYCASGCTFDDDSPLDAERMRAARLVLFGDSV